MATKPNEPTNDDNFAAAFAQLAELDDKPIPATGIVTATPPVVDEAAKAEADKAAAEAAEATAKAEADAAAAEAAAKANEGKTPEQIEAERVAAEAAAKAEADKAAADAAAAAAAAAEEDLLKKFARAVRTAPVEEKVEKTAPPPPDFTKEEADFLAAYEKDFPDVARAEAMRRRAEYKLVVAHVFQEIGATIAPLVEAVRTLSERTHIGDLTQAVPDYSVTRDAVIAWAQKQPAYLQPAYKHVIEQGTVEEVADLVARYKAANGITTSTTREVPKPPVPAVSDAAKKAAAALAPVAAKRSVQQQAEPTDFESAFAKFAETV